ncbi:MAG TPA: Gfo/Idh/MocA family oxidoreductase [Chthonomonadaceae bacterium]|nr:Gfo/Idh/MocA family oxidoreductase [Chthonomonadaceae bacterium]
MRETRDPLSRRDLLSRAGVGTAVGMGLLNGLLPVHAEPVEKKRRVAANDKIVLGLIGCGGMGAADMRTLMEKPEVEVAALCDVDKNRMPGDIKDVTAKYGKAPALYGDYRKMLERKDINAVIIGTPDHWHALNLIHAVEADKDAYCEKPISHDITEAKSMDAAVKHHKKIVQVGTWQRSTSEFTSAVAYIRSGKLGKIVLTRAWKTDDFRVGHMEPSAPPANLDYEMWNGPAAYMPYAPNHLHSVWRWWLNYGTGMNGDWGVHMMDIALLGMSKDTDLVMPTEVTTYGGKLAYPEDDRTAPDTVQTIMRFREPDFVLHWQTGRDFPGKPDHGTEFVSADGKTVRVWRGGWNILDRDGTLLPKDRTEHTNDHWQNWLDCLKTREQPRSNLASMAQTTIVCHLANVALLAGETVHWSKEKMDLVGKAGRDTQSYAREYRKPWKLPLYKA